MDFLKRFNDNVKKINEGEKDKAKERARLPLAHVPKCRLVTLYDGKRKVVAWGISRCEAGILQRHVETKLRKISSHNEKSMFELTQVLIELEDN